MEAPTLTDMHLQAGRELRWPTLLRLTTDVIVSDAPMDACDNIDFDFLLELGPGARCMKAHLCMYEDRPFLAGVYTLNNVMLSTDPLRVFVPNDACIRMVPEEFDGSDPIMSALPLCHPVVTGVGVVRDADPDCGSFTVVGLSYQGCEYGWMRFEFLAHADLSEGPFPPQEELPRPCTLVSFDGVLRGTPSGTTLHVDIHRLQHLQYAHTTLLAKLGIVPDHAGKVFAERAARLAIRDQMKISTLHDGNPGQGNNAGQGSGAGQGNGAGPSSGGGHGGSAHQGSSDVGAKRIRRF
ncbi:hypothetical protein OC834_006239 [Tilletia horrida]|nr:hypothetical protein OC834_006239 [Tilletia horrida]